MFRSSKELKQSFEMIHPIFSNYHTSREINENPQCESVYNNNNYIIIIYISFYQLMNQLI